MHINISDKYLVQVWETPRDFLSPHLAFLKLFPHLINDSKAYLLLTAAESSLSVFILVQLLFFLMLSFTQLKLLKYEIFFLHNTPESNNLVTNCWD